jgi:uncharacterized protein (TIGR01777 family)
MRDGHRVIVYSRDIMNARRLFGADAWIVDRLGDIAAQTHITAVVHLAGARIVGVPWSERRREVLSTSRTRVMQDLLGLMRRLEQPPRVLVSASAVGFYGVPDGGPVDESAPPQPGRFQSDLCVAAEHEAVRAEALGIRVVRLRFGIVLGAGGGAYPGLALASRLGLGSRLGTGKQAVPWIHLDDAVGLIAFAIEQQAVSGAVNAVAPETVSQSEFAREMAASFHRRVHLWVPGLALRLAMGEMSELLLCGQWVVPKAALAAGYSFRMPTLKAALAALAQTRS